MTEPGVHEIYAVKFAENTTGTRGHYFMGADGEPHDEHLQLDYFVWVIHSPEQDIVLDAGFTAARNATRRRDHWEDPSRALERVGVDPARVGTVILSHLHYDHVGDLGPFTNAEFVLQADELAFWTGPYGWRPELRTYVEIDDLTRILRLAYDGRVRLVEGSYEVADGVRVEQVGGHTPGMQVTVVRTASGPVVLAADASHFFENVEGDKPFAVHTDLPGMYRAFERMRTSAKGGFVVAGHDPSLFDRFPAVPGQEGHALRIA